MDKEKMMFAAIAVSLPLPVGPLAARYEWPDMSLRRVLVVMSALVLGVIVMAVTLAVTHGDLLSQMEVFKGVKEIKGVTEFLDDIKGYLLSIVLAGFTIAAVGAGAAKFVGHSRANDLIFNIGVGVAIFAAIPTLAA